MLKNRNHGKSPFKAGKRKGQCRHPDENVLQKATDKAWEGTCQKCGKRVKLTATSAAQDKGMKDE